MTIVAGVDSSTQSCKVVIREAETGRLVRHGRSAHPEGTEVHPDAWWVALQTALAEAGGLADVAAVAVAAQQHGMVCLDEAGGVVRPALLWNDTRSADAAVDLINELGGGATGRRAWAYAVGVVPVASFTVTKLRWLAQNEPAAAARTATVCLPHDWLTWRLGTDPALERLRTDRGDASGTGYWPPRVDHEELSRLALSAPAGADGLVIVPYLEGERSPDRPDATDAVHGLRLANATAAHLARAAVEGLLCGMADAIDALVTAGARVDRVFLIGGGARSDAVRRIAPTVLGHPVLVPPPGEYVADGAARQAGWALSGNAQPPPWARAGVETYDSDVVEAVRARYAQARDFIVARQH